MWPKFDCSKCSTDPKLRAKNGCDRPMKRPMTTSIGTKIDRCPLAEVEPHVMQWWDTHCVTGGEPFSFTESQDASPVLVSALCTIRDTQARREAAEMKLRTAKGGPSHGDAA